MRIFLKYILIIIALIALVLSYFRYTESGQKNVYTLLGFYASAKLNMPVEIQSINISKLPYVKAKLLLHKHYKVNLDGFIENKHMKLRYTLDSDCFTSNVCTFDDTININGTLTGWRGHLNVKGEGKALDGNVSYDFIKEKKQYKDIHLILNDINASKLFTLLDQKILFKDKINATVNLDAIDSIDDEKHTFNITMQTKHSGSFQASGNMHYDNENMSIKGKSTNFGGILHFSYADKKLHLDLQKISLKSLMKTFHTQAILDANITGKGVYDLTHKTMELKTKLHHAKLLPSPLLETIEKNFSLDLKNEIFNNSSLTLKFQNKTLSSNLTLANKDMHLILKDTTFNDTHDAMRTYIDIKVPKHSANGKLHIRNTGIKEKLFQEFYLTFDGLIEKHYNLVLDGILSDSFINISYNLHAKRLPSPIVTIVDDINLSGHISGDYTRLHISGEGLAMEGKVKFKGIKEKEHLEDVSLELQAIHTLKLFTLLGQPTFPNGKADLNASLPYVSISNIKGDMTYTLKKGLYQKLPLSLHTKAHFQEDKITFNAHAKLSTVDINLTKGVYHLDTNTSKVLYTFSTKNLAPLESLIGKYKGAFSARGALIHNKGLQIRGLSQTFGGMVDFLYKKDMLYVDLEKVSLNRLMNLFDSPKMLNAQVNGNINYDYTKEQLLIRADLNNTRFLQSDLVRTIFQKSGINMLKEVFPHSTLFAIYQHNILAGDLILKNKQSHFIVKNTQLNTKEKKVNAHFDLRMQGQEFSGKVYGSLQSPQIKLDMKKLIRYQMDKQVDSVIGKGNRELMESMPMGDVAKDMATDMGAELMDMFF